MEIRSDLREEIWKDIKGYEGKYQISSFGNIKSLNFNHTGKEKLLVKKVNHKGYEYVTLYNNGKQFYPRIHRIVAETFIQNLDNLPQVNHIDGNKCNNNVENLEWCTNLENMRHAIQNNLVRNKGKYNKRSKRVAQINEKNEIVNIFDSLGEASRYLNIGYKVTGRLSMVCNNKINMAYGYKWKFI